MRNIIICVVVTLLVLSIMTVPGMVHELWDSDGNGEPDPPAIAGDMMIEGLAIVDMRLNEGPSDGEWSGITIAGTASRSLVVGDLVIYNTSSAWELAIATASPTARGHLGLCVETSDTGVATTILLEGFIKSTAVDIIGTEAITNMLYVGEVAGDLQIAAPSDTGDIVRLVGTVLNSSNTPTIHFAPDLTWIEVG